MKLDDYDDDERTLRSHLSLIHGVYVGDVKTLAGLVEAHQTSHGDPDSAFYVTHTHDGITVNMLIGDLEFDDGYFQ